MSIEQGTGSDKLWTGVLSILLILEVMFIIGKASCVLNYFFNSLDVVQYLFYTGLSILYIFALLLFLTASDSKESIIDTPYYRCMIFFILNIIPILLTSPLFIIILTIFTCKTYFKDVINGINTWADKNL